jgi:hypothetical protein
MSGLLLPAKSINNTAKPSGEPGNQHFIIIRGTALEASLKEIHKFNTIFLLTWPGLFLLNFQEAFFHLLSKHFLPLGKI